MSCNYPVTISGTPLLDVLSQLKQMPWLQTSLIALSTLWHSRMYFTFDNSYNICPLCICFSCSILMNVPVWSFRVPNKVWCPRWLMTVYCNIFHGCSESITILIAIFKLFEPKFYIVPLYDLISIYHTVHLALNVNILWYTVWTDIYIITISVLF